MTDKVLMLGNEAIARGAYEAGVKVSSAYPGTPSTEISEYLAKYDEVYAEWAPNEKVALEVAIGASMGGVRAMACMKHVGLNVAADPLFTVAYTGVNGGLVVFVADDPGIYSSQNEQDTRMLARAAGIPVLEPSDSMEAKEFTKYGFELSERYDTPVILRTTTRIAHSQGIVELADRVEVEDKPYQREIEKYVMMPGNAKTHHVILENRMKSLAVDGASFSIHSMEIRDKGVGIVTSGMAYQYVKEALPDASVLKLGMVNPLPRKLIEEFSGLVGKLYVIEELEPVMEEQIKSWGIPVVGKEILTIQGEYSANLLRKAILGEGTTCSDPASVPFRPPILCPGCPHRSTYSVLKDLKVHAMGDIGCYTLGAVTPLEVVDTTICMGSSISTLHGLEKAKGRDYVKNWVAVIGDSTFMHTGVNSLMNMVYNKAAGTVIILDNSTTGMTGHQEHAATGKTLKGETSYAISIPDLCRGMGVRNVTTINALDVKALKETIRKELQREEVSVIIAKSPCVLLNKEPSPERYGIGEEDCKQCGMCMKYGCPAISKKESGQIWINEAMCNGCGHCTYACKFGAIHKGGRP